MCDLKNHNLITISKTNKGMGEYEVVRWCEDCGAVVIDVDIDGKTYPGNKMNMKFPKILLEDKIK